jgi:hypothetical protein
MINVIDSNPLKLLLSINNIDDKNKRNQAILAWYDHHVKDISWFIESSTEDFNPFSFREHAYQRLTNEMCKSLFNHPNVNITTQYLPHFGKVRITAQVGLLKFPTPPPSADRNQITGMTLPLTLTE